MDIKAGNKYPAGALSNFARRPFVLDDVQINSMEGFVQSLKFSNPDMQRQICTLHGKKAKMAGKNKRWVEDQTLYWLGQPIKRDSQQYQDLLDRAYQAMFDQNPKAQKALLATGDAQLKHSVGRRKVNETVLTRQEFCSRLMKIREQVKAEQYMQF